MTSGFEYKIDINAGTARLLKSSPEFEALKEVLNESGLTGECELTLCGLGGHKLGPMGWKGPDTRDESKDYESHAKRIVLVIPKLVEVTEDQHKSFKSMEIEHIPDTYCIRKADSFAAKETYSVEYIKYQYITKAGEQVLKIFAEENVSYDIYQMMDFYPNLFISSETEIPNMRLIREKKSYRSVDNGTYKLHVYWPNDATTKFLPTLKEILGQLEQK